MMATKQLNSVNPRNFREKIELLKKKEAASTANFAAAIRDAREIRQIAGACDPTQIKSRAVQSLLERSLSKACSASNISSTSTHESGIDSVADRTHPNFDSSDASHGATCGGLSREPTRALTSNINEHLVSLLGTPATTVDSHSADLCALGENRSTGNHQNWSAFPSRGSTFGNEGTSASLPYISAAAHTPSQCSQTLNTGAQPGPNSVSPAFLYRRVQRYASGDQLPSMGFPTAHPQAATSTATHPRQTNSSFHTPLGPKAVTSSYIRDDPSLRSVPCAPHVPVGGRCLYTAQTSLGPLNSSSPYCGTQVMGAYSRPYMPSGMPQSMVTAAPGVPDEHVSSNTAAFNVNIDWRRVSSDSSIHHSVMNYPTTMTTDHGVYGNRISPTVPSEFNAAAGPSTIPGKRSVTPRPHFPTEVGVTRAPAYDQMSCYNPNAVPMVGTAVSTTVPQATLSQTDSSLGEDHVLPAKRPFTGSSVQSVNSASPDHYSQMNALSLDDPNSRLDRSNEQRPILSRDGSHATPPSANLPPPNTGGVCTEPNNAGFLKPKSPTARPADPTELSGDLGPLSGYDSGDLDRYLQIPAAFLDSDGGERWAGRRDSCTMTAEVLSALNAASTDSPLIVEKHKCEPTGLSNSTATKLAGHPDMMASSETTSNYYCPESAAPLFESGPMQPTDFQDVASKLGISMTPNDYQLLTNPQLANYVTDENTETQLLG